MADFIDLPDDEDLPTRRHGRSGSPWPIVGLTLAAVVFFGGIGAAVYFAAKDITHAKKPIDTPKEAPLPEPVKPKPKAKPPAVVERPSPEPVKPKVWTFKEAWAEASEAVMALEADEPARTEAAMKILTGGEFADLRTSRNTRRRARILTRGPSDGCNHWACPIGCTRGARRRP